MRIEEIREIEMRTYDDFVRPVEVGAFLAGGLDVQD